MRARADDPTVYLVQRDPKLRYFGGFWAFPGGAVDSDDIDERDLVEGGIDDDAPFVLSAAREALEELGLWLASTAPPRDLKELRREVTDDESKFAVALRQAGARVPADRFQFFARLLTPAFSPIRFDTVFYRLDLPDCLEPRQPVIWPGELTDGRWQTAGQWMEQWRRGDVLIPPPVILMLRILERHGWDGANVELDALTEGFARGKLHPIFYNPGVQLLPLLTPTLPPATHTNAYIVGRDPAYLIDPATPHPEEQQRLDEAIDDALDDGRRIEAIILTHHHPDHIGAVHHVRRRYGLPVWAHPITRDLVAPAITVDRTLDDGDRLPLGVAPNGKEGWEAEVHFTPGHAAGHICLFERVYGSLVLGDMVSTLSSILVHPDDGDMLQYENSLERLGQLPSRMIYPAHGPASSAGADLLRAQLAHRQARELSIVSALRPAGSTVDEIVAEVYADVPREMHGYAALSVRSVLDKLVTTGQAAMRGNRWVASPAT